MSLFRSISSVLLLTGILLQTPGAVAASTSPPALPDLGDYGSRSVHQKSSDALDAASRAATAGAMRSMPDIKVPAGLRVDIDQIASRYKEMGKPPKDDGLLVFVSMSMPMAALVKLGQQSKRAGAVLVLRGLEGGLSRGSWSRMMDELKPVAETGASIQIHPDLFRLYGVTQVPTFVLMEPEEAECVMDSTRCQTMLRATGDVSLSYVLDKWADGEGVLADKARSRLKRLGGVL
jgi:conjugal transfer pilus assembly protein TrbC